MIKIKTTLAILLTMYLPVLTGEIMTTSVTVVHLFHPLVFLVLTITYGFSVLLIHELVVRWRLGLIGILLLGVAFGVYSEGLAARTLLLSENVPLDSFDHYSMFLGLNVAWTLVISTWHALLSVAVPLLIVHFFLPQEFSRPWLSRKIFLLLALILFGLMTVNFFLEPVPEASSPASAFSYGLIALIAAVPMALARVSSYPAPLELSGERPFSLTPFLLGFLFLGHLLLTITMSESKVPLWIFFPVTVAVIVAFAWILAKKGWLANPFILLFGLGACLSHTLLQAAVSILGPRPPIYLATGVVLVLG